MTTTPRTGKGRSTRQRLIAAAGDVALSAPGRLEVGEVARRAGVAPSLVNKYFDGRDGLISALLTDFYERLNAAVLDEDLSDLPWVDAERARLERGVDFYLSDPLLPVIFTHLPRSPLVTRTESEQVARVVGGSARNIRRAQREGRIPRDVDPRLAAAAIFGALRGVLTEAVVAPGRRPSRRKIVDQLWRQVLAAVDLATATPPASLPPGASRPASRR